MKALSVRQPWAHMIMMARPGGKDVENRSWSTEYRGRLAIHASKACTSKEWYTARQFCMRRGLPLPPPRSHLVRGAILGIVTLADVLPPTESAEELQGWRVAGQYGWHLTEPQRLDEPVQASGNLGLWTMPMNVEAAIVDQLGVFGT